MTNSMKISNEREYDKLPYSEKYYENKDKAELVSKTKKFSKKISTVDRVASHSSSSSSSASSSTASSSSLSSRIVHSVTSSGNFDDLGSRILKPIMDLRPLAGAMEFRVRQNGTIATNNRPADLFDLRWLKQDELIVVNELFENHAFDEEISFYDLLSFDIFNLLKQLEACLKYANLSDEVKYFNDEVFSVFNYKSIFLYTSLFLYNAEDSEDSLVWSAFKEKSINIGGRFFVKKDKIASYYYDVKKNLNTLSLNIERSKKMLKLEGGSRAKLQLHLLNTKTASIKEVITKIDRSLELFGSFLKRENRFDLLLFGLNHFPNSKRIVKDSERTRDSLLLWIEFIQRAYLDLNKAARFTDLGSKIHTGSFENLTHLITSKKTIDPNRYSALENFFKDFFLNPSKNSIYKNKTIFQETNEKNLTFKEYCDQHGLISTETQTQDQLLCMLAHNFMHHIVIFTLAKDFWRIIDNVIIPPLTQGNHISCDTRLERIRGSLFTISSDIDTDSLESSSLLKTDFQKSLDLVFNGLRTAFEDDIFQNTTIYRFLKADLRSLKPDFVNWINVFKEHQISFIQLQEKIYLQLNQTRQKFLEQFATKALPTAEEIESINKMVFQQMERFFTRLFFLHDILALFQKNKINANREEQMIPQELADFIVFDEQDFIRLQPKEKELTTKTVSEGVLKPVVPVAKLDSRLTRKDFKELEKLSLREKPRERSEPSQEELRSIYKRRKLMQYLSKAGYTTLSSRGHGSHTVLKDETGKITVVPRGKKKNGIAKGTLRAIEQQVQVGTSPTTVIKSGASKHRKKNKGKK